MVHDFDNNSNTTRHKHENEIIGCVNKHYELRLAQTRHNFWKILFLFSY